MLSFLFWNLHGMQLSTRMGSLRTRISRLAQHNNIDVFIFVEPAFVSEVVVELLNEQKIGKYWHSSSEVHRIQIYTRLPRSKMKAQYDSVDDRMTMRRLVVEPDNLLLAAVHLPSQLRWRPENVGYTAREVHWNIIQLETDLKNPRTILVGDMNLNPFDHGMIAADAFHGVMTKALAARGERTVSGVTHKFFYNPMWGCFGDRSPGPPGTYFYTAGRPIEYHWHMFDQVLLRPELMNALEELRILDHDGESSLLDDNGRPDEKTASDHLPILFRLQMSTRETNQ